MLPDTLAKLLELPALERIDIAMALWDSLSNGSQKLFMTSARSRQRTACNHRDHFMVVDRSNHGECRRV